MNPHNISLHDVLSLGKKEGAITFYNEMVLSLNELSPDDGALSILTFVGLMNRAMDALGVSGVPEDNRQLNIPNEPT